MGPRTGPVGNAYQKDRAGHRSLVLKGFKADLPLNYREVKCVFLRGGSSASCFVVKKYERKRPRNSLPEIKKKQEPGLSVLEVKKKKLGGDHLCSERPRRWIQLKEPRVGVSNDLRKYSKIIENTTKRRDRCEGGHFDFERGL